MVMKKCVMCDKEFEAIDSAAKKGINYTKFKRPRNAITCRRKCSRRLRTFTIDMVVSLYIESQNIKRGSI